MKRKDITYLILAAIIFVAIGLIVTSLLKPKGGAATDGVTVEVVTPIAAEFNQSALSTLSDASKTIDYYLRPDLSVGLNNTKPFGQ